MVQGSDILTASPEFLLICAGLVGVLMGAVGKGAFASLSRFYAALTLAGASALSAAQIDAPSALAFNELYQTTAFLAFAKTVGYGVAAICVLLAGGYFVREKMNRFEYAMLILFGSAGMGLMLSANNLMTLYMGVETLSLSSYVLAAFNRDSKRSAEAGLKYFVLGALASGLLLFGSSLVYGHTGSAQFADIARADMSVGLTFGMVLMLIGLAFKASAAPFHVWTPDVYEGAPTPVTTYFATAPKIAAVAVLANLLFTVFGPYEDQWSLMVSLLAAASMLIGSFGALGQNNIKRLMAYSSIANVGFALMAVAAGELFGAGPVLTYMTIYVLSTLGIFGVVLTMRRRDGMVEDIADLNGLSQSKPGIAIALTVLVLSVGGIPPLAGFWGKWVVFEAAIKANLLWLVAVAVISSVVALGYYLRIIWAVWAKSADDEALEPSDGIVALSIYGAAVLAFPVLFIWIGWLNGLTTSAAAG